MTMTTMEGTHQGGRFQRLTGTLASHLLRQRSRDDANTVPTPFQDMEGAEEKWKDRTSTGPHDALDVQGWKRQN